MFKTACRWPLGRTIAHDDEFGVFEAVNKGISSLLLALGPVEDALTLQPSKRPRRTTDRLLSANGVSRLAVLLASPRCLTLVSPNCRLASRHAKPRGQSPTGTRQTRQPKLGLTKYLLAVALAL